jgi:exodeoxyribonuclease-3
MLCTDLVAFNFTVTFEFQNVCKMRIISYNVNGIRVQISILSLQQANPDVICLQEIKATPEQIPLDFELAGYPYHYWFPATKKGYSGTAILSKIKPNVFYGTGIEHMDFEGRNIRIDDALSVMSLYLPSGTNAEIGTQIHVYG